MQLLGETPLMAACKFGHTNFVEIILKRGVDVDAQHKVYYHSLIFPFPYLSAVPMLMQNAKVTTTFLSYCFFLWLTPGKPFISSSGGVFFGRES
jgi:ankyrin repeat protein